MAIQSVFNSILDPQKVYNWEVEFMTPQNTSSGENIKYYAKNVSLPMHSVEYAKRYFSKRKYHVPSKDNSPSVITAAFWDNETSGVYEFFLTWLFYVTKKESEINIFGVESELLSRRALNGQTLSAANFANISGAISSLTALFTNRDNQTEKDVLAESGIRELGAHPVDYKMDCKITTFDSAGNGRVIHKFSGCFVAEVGEINLNYNESADATFDVKLVYDKYSMERLPV